MDTITERCVRKILRLLPQANVDIIQLPERLGGLEIVPFRYQIPALRLKGVRLGKIFFCFKKSLKIIESIKSF